MSNCNDCGCLTGTSVYYCDKCLDAWYENQPKGCECTRCNHCNNIDFVCEWCIKIKRNEICRVCGSIFVYNGLCKKHHIKGKYYE